MSAEIIKPPSVSFTRTMFFFPTVSRVPSLAHGGQWDMLGDTVTMAMAGVKMKGADTGLACTGHHGR